MNPKEIAMTGKRIRVLRQSAAALLSLFLVVWGLISFVPLIEAKAPRQFTNRNFEGAYGFSFSGFIGEQYNVASGVLIADGAGGASGTIYPNPPGAAVGSPDGTALAFTMPYTVRPDGTGFTEVTIFTPEVPVVLNLAIVLTEVRGRVAETVLFSANSAPFVNSGLFIRQTRGDDRD